jgi:hypothetical protein
MSVPALIDARVAIADLDERGDRRYDGRRDHRDTRQSDTHADRDAGIRRLSERRCAETDGGRKCKRSEFTHVVFLDCLSKKSIVLRL